MVVILCLQYYKYGSENTITYHDMSISIGIVFCTKIWWYATKYRQLPLSRDKRPSLLCNGLFISFGQPIISSQYHVEIDQPNISSHVHYKTVNRLKTTISTIIEAMASQSPIIKIM